MVLLNQLFSVATATGPATGLRLSSRNSCYDLTTAITDAAAIVLRCVAAIVVAV